MPKEKLNGANVRARTERERGKSVTAAMRRKAPDRGLCFTESGEEAVIISVKSARVHQISRTGGKDEFTMARKLLDVIRKFRRKGHDSQT